MYKANVMKSSNYDAILECIFRNPGISRKDISDMTGITPATVTTTVASMLADGILEELGRIEEDRGTVGRARIALDIAPAFGYTVGVEFTFSCLTVCAADLRGNMLYFKSVPYTEALGQQITRSIIDEIRKCLAAVPIPPEKIIGIGIGVPGHVDDEGQHLVSTNPDWKDFNARIIRQAFPCPVFFENNIRCIALSEYLYHPRNTPASFALFHIGRGMFCANITEDELYIGTTYGSGEIGHTIAIPDGKRCKCGKRGCLETVANEGAIVEDCMQLYRENPASLLRNYASSPEELTIEDVSAAYSLGDPAVRRQVTQALRYLCIATLNIAVLMNPEKLLLHGRLFNHPEIQSDLLEMIQKEFDFTGNNYRLGSVDFLPCKEKDGALGGAALAVWKCLIHE